MKVRNPNRYCRPVASRADSGVSGSILGQARLFGSCWQVPEDVFFQAMRLREWSKTLGESDDVILSGYVDITAVRDRASFKRQWAITPPRSLCAWSEQISACVSSR